MAAVTIIRNLPKEARICSNFTARASLGAPSKNDKIGEKNVEYISNSS
jgi:hypothetical protein